MKASVSNKGAVIMLEFEGKTYKFDQAISLIKTKTLSPEQEEILLKAMGEAVAKAQ